MWCTCTLFSLDQIITLPTSRSLTLYSAVLLMSGPTQDHICGSLSVIRLVDYTIYIRLCTYSCAHSLHQSLLFMYLFIFSFLPSFFLPSFPNTAKTSTTKQRLGPRQTTAGPRLRRLVRPRPNLRGRGRRVRRSCVLAKEGGCGGATVP